MEPYLFFNPPNFIYWVLLGVIAWLEAGWDLSTWLILLVLSIATRFVRVDRLILEDLWLRRENHRWTLQYFTAFIMGLVPVLWAGWNIITWMTVIRC